ncbi:MAG: hypothetical protein ACYDHP_11500 [Ferrimicrobium sp.]
MRRHRLLPRLPQSGWGLHTRVVLAGVALSCALGSCALLPDGGTPSGFRSEPKPSGHASCAAVNCRVLLPPRNPLSNWSPLVPGQVFTSDCNSGVPTASGVLPYQLSSCIAGYRGELDNALRTKEGLASVQLPRDWSTLTLGQRLFVAIDLVRLIHGLAPVIGMLKGLNRLAARGIAPLASSTAFHDPSIPTGWSLPNGMRPSYATDYEYQSIAGEGVSILQEVMSYLYQDGWQGRGRARLNLDCTSAHARGCWGHRDTILWQPPSTTDLIAPNGVVVVTGSPTGSSIHPPAATALVMGAAGLWSASQQVVGTAAVVLSVVIASDARPQFSFTWTQALAEGAGITHQASDPGTS